MIKYAVLSIGFFIIVWIWLFPLLRNAENTKNSFVDKPIFEIAVLPHHGITGKNINIFYSDLQKKYKNFDRIIIISPDHFGALRKHIGSLPLSLDTICYRSSCVIGWHMLPYSADSEVWSIFNASWSTREHGLGEHILRIARYFPEAKVSPIILRRKFGAWEWEKDIAKVISEIPDKRVLVIASVDFSHHVREDFARLHDAKSIDTLRFGGVDDFSSLEVDCRNCLAVAKVIADKKWKQDFNFSLRTSVDSLFWIESGIDNTSHIFWTFVPRNDNQKYLDEHSMTFWSGVFLFTWDTHWARAFPYYEKKTAWYMSTMAHIFYQQYDTSNDLTIKYNKILTGFDDVIVNFESALSREQECIPSRKEVVLSTDPKYITWFHSLWITLANVANNHSHDCGKSAFENSEMLFKSGGIIPFWYDTVHYKTIRGNTYAYLGLDMIESQSDIPKIVDSIKKMSLAGNLVLVNIHWWIEYQKIPTERQKKIAHDFVDAGARLVIGHHSHVVGEEEVYKGIPIYYSLGNFIFDQPFPETLGWLLVGCEVSRLSTICNTASIYRHPQTYILSFDPF